MRRYTISVAIAALVCALLLVGVVVAQSSGQTSPAQYVAVQGVASGGHYRLTSLAPSQAEGGVWQARGVASGEGYSLASTMGTGTPCCCNYLPCVLRKGLRT